MVADEKLDRHAGKIWNAQDTVIPRKIGETNEYKFHLLETKLHKQDTHIFAH